jgi:hypothetical protein
MVQDQVRDEDVANGVAYARLAPCTSGREVEVRLTMSQDRTRVTTDELRSKAAENSGEERSTLTRLANASSSNGGELWKSGNGRYYTSKEGMRAVSV